MKKIFIAIAAVTAMTFASCGGSSNGNGDNDTIDTAAIVEADTTIDETEALQEAIENGDQDAIKAEATKLQAKIQELIAKGDTAEVKKFAYKLQEFAANHKGDLDKLATGETSVADLVNGVINLPSTASGLATEAKDAATSDANTVSNQTKAAAQAAKETVKAAAKEKATEATDAAAKKANEATTKAVNDAAAAAKKKLGL